MLFIHVLEAGARTPMKVYPGVTIHYTYCSEWKMIARLVPWVEMILCVFFLSSICGVQSGYFGSHVDTTINRQPFMIKSIDAMYASYLTQYFLTSFLYFTTN